MKITNVLAGGEEHGQALPGPRVRESEAMTLYHFISIVWP